MDYDNLTPQYRIEEYLEAIVKGWAEATQHPYPDYPSWRIEEFLDAFITYIWEDGDHPRHPCPDPVWRLEECLRAIYDVMTGAATPWPFPLPTTNRIEEYLAAIHAYLADGTELPVPEPVWRIEQWLAYVLDGVKQGGDITKTVSGTMVHITDALAKAALSVLVSIEPIQDLHGYSSPWPAGGGKNKWNPTTGSTATSWEPYENICPISGRTGLSVYVGPTQDQQDATTYAVDWTSEAGTVYGGTLDVVTGVLTVDRITDSITKDSAWYGFSTGTGNSSAVVQLAYYQNCKYIDGSSSRNGAISSTGKETGNYWVNARQNEVPGDGDMCFAYSSSGQLRFHRTDVANITDLNAFKAAFPDTQICYYLATPLTYQLTAQEVQMLLGENYVWASSGDTVSVTYYAEGNANHLQSLNILLGGNYSNPITLANALSHAIVSLTRYGLCAQASAPTLADPVPIKCNNGTLTVVDDDLPAGYKRLLGITFDGNFRYETGEALTGADDVTLTIDNVASSGKNLFGSYNGSNDKNFSLYIYGNASTGSYFRYGDQLKRPKYGTGRRTITFGASGTSGFAEDSTVTPDEFTTPANTYIGMLPNSSSPAFSGDIIGSITVSNRLEWIPCENDGGVIGYYERVNGNFIAPTGNGTPVSLGYDYGHAHVEVVGTPEVLTVVGNLLSRDGETTGKIISSEGVVSENANYSISAPFVLPAGNYTCTWSVGAGGSRPFSVFAVDESGTPQSDGKLFYQARSETGINTGEFTVEAETLVVASYRNNATDLAIYSPQQTATVPTLLSVGDVKDEAEIISGLVTRRVTACLYDGTQPVGDVYMSTTGGKDAGAIIVYPLATPTTEQTTAQPLNTNEGTNVVDSVANVGPLTAEVTYKANT